MAWNPAVYNKFKTERFVPFYDLLNLIFIRSDMDVIDLGCGTGELTAKLGDHLPDSNVAGIDNSPEMLKESDSFSSDRVSFRKRSIEEQMELNQKWDLIFSNAAIQWVENHEKLIPQLISSLKTGGQLLIQIPAQHHNITNILLNELADQEPYRTALVGWKRNTPVLELEEYGQLFYEHGSKSMTLYEKIYPIILKDLDALVEWVSGTALIPYLQKLDAELGHHFKLDFKNRLLIKFKSSPVFYPFKRMILEASFLSMINYL